MEMIDISMMRMFVLTRPFTWFKRFVYAVIIRVMITARNYGACDTGFWSVLISVDRSYPALVRSADRIFVRDAGFKVVIVSIEYGR